MENSTLIFIVFTRNPGGIFHGDSVHLPESQRNDFTSMANSHLQDLPAGLAPLSREEPAETPWVFGFSNGEKASKPTLEVKKHTSIIHHPSSIIHHPSSIIHHPSSIIHHPCTFFASLLVFFFFSLDSESMLKIDPSIYETIAIR